MSVKKIKSAHGIDLHELLNGFMSVIGENSSNIRIVIPKFAIIYKSINTLTKLFNLVATSQFVSGTGIFSVYREEIVTWLATVESLDVSTPLLSRYVKKYHSLCDDPSYNIDFDTM